MFGVPSFLAQAPISSSLPGWPSSFCTVSIKRRPVRSFSSITRRRACFLEFQRVVVLVVFRHIGAGDQDGRAPRRLQFGQRQRPGTGDHKIGRSQQLRHIVDIGRDHQVFPRCKALFFLQTVEQFPRRGGPWRADAARWAPCCFSPGAEVPPPTSLMRSAPRLPPKLSSTVRSPAFSFCRAAARSAWRTSAAPGCPLRKSCRARPAFPPRRHWLPVPGPRPAPAVCWSRPGKAFLLMDGRP